MIYIVIPAYNEEDNLRVLLKRIDAMMREDCLDYQAIIVDDGSRDNTALLIEQYAITMPVSLVTHPVNFGVHEAFRTGFKEVLSRVEERDIVVTMEADNTSDIRVLEKMLAKIASGDDLVLASCYAKDGGVEGTVLHRHILSGCANLLLRIFFPLKGLHTYSSFYRVYRAKILKDAYARYGDRFIEEKGFVCVVEMLVKFARMGVRISEVPIVLKGDLRQRKRKMKIIPTIKGYLKLIYKQAIRPQQYSGKH